MRCNFDESPINGCTANEGMVTSDVHPMFVESLMNEGGSA